MLAFTCRITFMFGVIGLMIAGTVYQGKLTKMLRKAVAGNNIYTPRRRHGILSLYGNHESNLMYVFRHFCMYKYRYVKDEGFRTKNGQHNESYFLRACDRRSSFDYRT